MTKRKNSRRATPTEAQKKSATKHGTCSGTHNRFWLCVPYAYPLLLLQLGELIYFEFECCLLNRKTGADTTTQNYSAIVISTPALLSLSVKLVSADVFFFSGKHTLRLFPPQAKFFDRTWFVCSPSKPISVSLYRATRSPCPLILQWEVCPHGSAADKIGGYPGSYFHAVFAHNPTRKKYFHPQIWNPAGAIDFEITNLYPQGLYERL